MVHGDGGAHGKEMIRFEDCKLDGIGLWDVLEMDETGFSPKDEATDENLEAMERRGLPSEALAFRACRDGNEVLCGLAAAQAGMMLVPARTLRNLCRNLAIRLKPGEKSTALDEMGVYLRTRAKRRREGTDSIRDGASGADGDRCPASRSGVIEA